MRIPDVLSSLHSERSMVATDHDHWPTLPSAAGLFSSKAHQRWETRSVVHGQPGAQRPAPLHERAGQRNAAIV